MSVGKMSVGLMSVGQMSDGQIFVCQIVSAKCKLAKYLLFNGRLIQRPSGLISVGKMSVG